MFLLQTSAKGVTLLVSTKKDFCLYTKTPQQHLRETSHILEIKTGWNTSRWYMRFVLTNSHMSKQKGVKH